MLKASLPCTFRGISPLFNIPDMADTIRVLKGQDRVESRAETGYLLKISKIKVVIKPALK